MKGNKELNDIPEYMDYDVNEERVDPEGETILCSQCSEWDTCKNRLPGIGCENFRNKDF